MNTRGSHTGRRWSSRRERASQPRGSCWIGAPTSGARHTARARFPTRNEPLACRKPPCESAAAQRVHPDAQQGRRDSPQRRPALFDRDAPRRQALRLRPAASHILAAGARRLRKRLRDQSLIDELAAAVSLDPLDVRLRNLDDPRARAVLEAVAERGGWAGARAIRMGAAPGSASPATRTATATRRSWSRPRSMTRLRDRPRARRHRRRRRPDRRPGRADQPARGRLRPGRKLDAQGVRHLRRGSRHEHRLGELPDPALQRGPGDRDGADRPPRRALPGGRGGDAGTDGRGDRQRRLRRGRTAAA